MSERRFPIPISHDVLNMYERPDFEDLTAEQKEAIVHGPGWVHQPVQMHQFEGIADFRNCDPRARNLMWHGSDIYDLDFDMPPPNSFAPYHYGSNNFIGFFRRQPEGLMALVAEQTPAFLRFRILYPDAVAYLDQRVPLLADPSDDVWEELLQIYNVMATLVDRQDRGVVRSDSTVDELYLTK